MRPLLAISLGDPAGIGPEIAAACLENSMKAADFVIFGHLATLERACRLENVQVELLKVEAPARAPLGKVAVVDVGPDCPPISRPGSEAARSQFLALQTAVTALLDGTCHALVTGPVSKVHVSSIEPGFTGHTEYLATRSGLQKDDVTMIFASRELAVGLVATHVPMRSVFETITIEHYTRTVNHTVDILRRLHPETIPSVAVAAFNPHAGEDGLLGTEEKELLEPFCAAMQNRDDAVITGPIPADAVFRDALLGKYQGVVAAYHDQAMIPLKLQGFGKTVNVTMGLPFVRTSPDHGVAYDIAGTGKADSSGMAQAIEIAIALTK